jgi:hypothetical protein
VVWHLLAASSGHTAKSFALNPLKGSCPHDRFRDRQMHRRNWFHYKNTVR